MILITVECEKNDDADLIGFIKNGQSFFSNMDDNNFKRQKEDINILYTIYLDKSPDKTVDFKKASMPKE